MKRIRAFSMMLAAILAVSLAACGGDSGSVNDTTADNSDVSTSTPEALTEADQHPLPEKNMEEFNLRFYNYDETYITWAINDLDAAEENGDNVNDAIYRRNRRIEDQYNCIIVENTTSKTHSNFRELMYAGDDSMDIAMLYDDSIAKFYCEGLLQTWDELPYVDLERSWWDQSANDVFQIKGRQCAAVGDFTLSMVTRGFVLMFNKDLIEQANLDTSLYDLVRQNKWTLDKFGEIAKSCARDLDGNGLMDENDQYATTGSVKLHFGSLITGCGVKYIDVDEGGNPYFAVPGNERTMEILTKIFDMHNGSNIFVNAVNDVHGGSNEAKVIFSSGKTVFNGTSTRGIANFRDCDFDIGILPYPKYTAEQESYHILTSGAGVAAIPVTLTDDRKENVSILLEALSRDSQENLLPTYREVVLKTKYSRDEDSAEMLDIIFDSITYDLGLSVFPQVTYYQYMEPYLSMTDTFASLTASLEPQVKASLDELMASLEKSK
ncbi:MAG: carbohydrate ABC transporter substrate-binding protein [Ruminococcaceae bacterium]|nr:carbohydrate ABC transporter substrate-binding protein [Oscillospiraceae bacterium]